MSTKAISWPGSLFRSIPRLASEIKTEPKLGPAARHAVVVERPALKRASIRRAIDWAALQPLMALSLIVLTGFMLLIYIFGINQSAALGYEMKKAQTKLNVLQEDQKKLLMRTAEVGSIMQIQSEADRDHLVQITNQEYLQPAHLSQR